MAGERMTAAVHDPPLDPGIAPYVEALQAGGVETFESCEGGIGHAYREPTIRFHGDRAAGWSALSVALAQRLPVASISRIWPIVDGEPTGPSWEIVFTEAAGRRALEEAGDG